MAADTLDRLRAAIAAVEALAHELGCTTLISLHSKEVPEALAWEPRSSELLTCHVSVSGGGHSVIFHVPVTDGVHCIVSRTATADDVRRLHRPAEVCQFAGDEPPAGARYGGTAARPDEERTEARESRQEKQEKQEVAR